jgi:hypothetical protein
MLVVIVPEHPVAVVIGCLCSSCPRMYCTVTREQSTGSSSSTFTSKATCCPNSKGWPSNAGAAGPDVARRGVGQAAAFMAGER